MAGREPTVSVVLPTHNRAGTLPRAIQSVLNQTYADFELIVVDDGSTDNTDAVIADVEDTRLKAITLETNQGASHARNVGIESSSAEFVAFQDSDDEWKPRKLERQMATFGKAGSEVGVVYTGVWRIRDGEHHLVPQPSVEPKEGDLSDILQRYNFISLPTAVVKRQCLERVGGFDEQLPRLQDWELWLRVSDEYEFRYVDEPLVTSYILKDSISRQDDRLAIAREHIVQKHRNRFDDDELAFQLLRTGHSMLRAGHGSAGRRYLRKAFVINPGIRNALLYTLSLFGTTTYNAAYQVRTIARQMFM